MPRIHHSVLKRELEVSDTAAEILTTVPRSPWKRGALRAKGKKPTATPNPTTSPQGGARSPSRED